MNLIRIIIRILVTESSVHLYAISTGITPYFMGIVFGYLMANNVTIDKQSKRKTYCLLIATAFFNLISLPMYDIVESNNVPIFLKYMVNPVIRTLIAASVCNTFYLLWNGVLPAISSFLSSRLLVVLGKFSFSIFIVHFLVLWYHIGTLRHQIDYSLYSQLFESLALYCTSVVIAYFVYLVFEAPANNLVKLAYVGGG